MTDFTLMVDTIGGSANNIPGTFKKVAGYVTGHGDVIWTEAQFARFEKTAGVVRICQDPLRDPFQANAFDIETGALSIADFVRMAGEREHQRKWNSCGYIEAANLGDLVQACEAAKLTMVELWVANWNLDESQAIGLLGTHVRGYPIVAVQYASPTSNPHTMCPGSSKTLSELNLDLSVTSVDWFPAPTPVQPPAPPQPAPKPTVIKAVLNLRVNDLNTTLPIESSDNGKTWQLG